MQKLIFSPLLEGKVALCATEIEITQALSVLFLVSHFV